MKLDRTAESRLQSHHSTFCATNKPAGIVGFLQRIRAFVALEMTAVGASECWCTQHCRPRKYPACAGTGGSNRSMPPEPDSQHRERRLGADDVRGLPAFALV